MRRASLLLSLSSLLLLSATAKPQQKAKAKSPAGASRAITSKTKSGIGTVANGKKNSSSKSARPVTTRLVRTKSGRLTRVVVHSPPPPSYQTHPDPERYVEIQKALADRGYFKGEPNGQWGDDSVDALRRFQAASNLPDDGKISALSLSGLGLGPRHDGSTASTVPLPTPDAASPSVAPAPSIVGSTVGPAASAPAPVPTGNLPVGTPHPPNLQ